MPTYVYEILDRKGEPTGRTFEISQSIKDEALAKHPETGEPVRRAILAPNIGGKWSAFTASGSKNQDKRLGELGFTKYKRSGGGTYEKTTGSGPNVIGGD